MVADGVELWSMVLVPGNREAVAGMVAASRDRARAAGLAWGAITAADVAAEVLAGRWSRAEGEHVLLLSGFAPSDSPGVIARVIHARVVEDLALAELRRAVGGAP